MIYILAFLVPPLGLLFNGQPFSALFNVLLIVFGLIFGWFFPVLFLVPSIHGVIAVAALRWQPDEPVARLETMSRLVRVESMAAHRLAESIPQARSHRV